MSGVSGFSDWHAFCSLTEAAAAYSTHVLLTVQCDTDTTVLGRVHHACDSTTDSTVWHSTVYSACSTYSKQMHSTVVHTVQHMAIAACSRESFEHAAKIQNCTCTRVISSQGIRYQSARREQQITFLRCESDRLQVQYSSNTGYIEHCSTAQQTAVQYSTQHRCHCSRTCFVQQLQYSAASRYFYQCRSLAVCS